LEAYSTNRKKSSTLVPLAGIGVCLILLMVAGLHEMAIIGSSVEMVLSTGFLLAGLLWVSESHDPRPQLLIYFLGVTPALLAGPLIRMSGLLAGVMGEGSEFYIYQAVGMLLVWSTVFVLRQLKVWSKRGKAFYSHRTAKCSAAGFLILAAVFYGIPLLSLYGGKKLLMRTQSLELGWLMVLAGSAALLSVAGTCFLWLAMRKKGEKLWSLIGFIAYAIAAAIQMTYLYTTFWLGLVSTNYAKFRDSNAAFDAREVKALFDWVIEFLGPFTTIQGIFSVVAFACFGYAFFKEKVFPKWACIFLMVLGLLSFKYSLASFCLFWLLGMAILVQRHLPKLASPGQDLGNQD